MKYLFLILLVLSSSNIFSQNGSNAVDEKMKEIQSTFPEWKISANIDSLLAIKDETETLIYLDSIKGELLKVPPLSQKQIDYEDQQKVWIRSLSDGSTI